MITKLNPQALNSRTHIGALKHFARFPELLALVVGVVYCSAGVQLANAASLKVTITDAETNAGIDELGFWLDQQDQVSKKWSRVSKSRGLGNGLYEFVDDRPGDYLLVQSMSNSKLFTPEGRFANRFLPARMGTIDLKDANASVEEKFQISASTSVKVRLIDSSGAPIPNANAIVVTNSLTNTGCTGDEDGRFNVIGANPNSEFQMIFRLSDRKYFPVLTIPADELKPADVVDRGDIVLPIPTGKPTIQGTAKYPDGTFDKGLSTLHIKSVDGKYKSRLYCNNGKFSQELPAGRYIVRNYMTGLNLERDKDLEVFEQEVEIKEGSICKVDFTIPKQDRIAERRAHEREAKDAKTEKSATESRLKKRRRPKSDTTSDAGTTAP